MKDKKRIDILLKIIEKVYTKNPRMQKLLEGLMIHVCKKGECTSP